MDDESKLRLGKTHTTEDDGAATPTNCDSFNSSCTATPVLVANCSSNAIISQELVDSSQRPPSVDRQCGSHVVKVITTGCNSGTQIVLTTSSGSAGLNSVTTSSANSRIPVKFIIAERLSSKIKLPISLPKLSPVTVFRAAQQTMCLSNTLASANNIKKMTLYPKENVTVIGEPSPKKAVISIPVKQSACYTIVGSQQGVGTSITSSYSAVGESSVINLTDSPVKIAPAGQQKIILQPISLHPATQNSIQATRPMMLTQDMLGTGPASSLMQQLSKSMATSSTFATAGQVKYVKLLTLPPGETAIKTNGNSASVLKPAVSPMQLVITGGKTVGSSPVIASDSCAQLPVQQVCQVLQTNDWRKSQTNTANQASSRASSASKRTILPSPFKSTYDQNVSAEELKSAVAHMTKQAALTMRDFQRKTGQRKVQNTMSKSRKLTDFGSQLSICDVSSTKSRSRVSSSTGSVDGFFGEKSRRPCNCSKSQCLKLYCECFANGEFCSDCNCISCSNNLEHEDDRQKAIRACLERNPYAFHPKIGKNREGDVGRQHSKGCHCKRSSCLKNYCECFEAKILCTDLCKCFGCKNFEQSTVRQSLMQLADAADTRVQLQLAATNRLHSDFDYSVQKPAVDTNGKRLPYSFMTMDVVEATNSCLLATAEECFIMRLSDDVSERQILEEYGRCLEQVIDAANRSSVS